MSEKLLFETYLDISNNTFYLDEGLNLNDIKKYLKIDEIKTYLNERKKLDKKIKELKTNGVDVDKIKKIIEDEFKKNLPELKTSIKNKDIKSFSNNTVKIIDRSFSKIKKK